MYPLGRIVSHYQLQNLFAYLFVLLIPFVQGCASVSSAIYEAPKYPMVVNGTVLEMQVGSTYHWLNQALANANTEILLCPNCSHIILRWAFPGWKGVHGMALINTLETSKVYWDSLSAMVMTKEDADYLWQAAQNCGYTTTKPTYIGMTSVAIRVSNYLAQVATVGEVMFSGLSLMLDDVIQRFVLGSGDL